jgi:hypothetical protein
MSDWLHSLPLAWMAFAVFGATYLIAAAICLIVTVLADARWLRAFKGITPGLLSPLGTLFALFVVFTAAQVWGDTDRAKTAVIREASALRTVVILAARFSGEPDADLRRLVRSHIEEAAAQEWPMMARRAANLRLTPRPLAEALQLTLALSPSGQGQQTAQREIITALENVFDARRQRIIISQSQVNFVKWLCLFLQAVCALLAIAMVHSDDRLASFITMGIFATGVAASVLLIASHDRPFMGQISVRPDPLLQVIPGIEISRHDVERQPVGVGSAIHR